MGKEGRRIVEKEHTTAHVANRTLKIYDELLKNKFLSRMTGLF